MDVCSDTTEEVHISALGGIYLRKKSLSKHQSKGRWNSSKPNFTGLFSTKDVGTQSEID